MKNALFSGITAKKDSDDSDEDKKKDQPVEEPAGEVNLLDFDAGPSQAAAADAPPTASAPAGDLLETGLASSAPNPNNLMDLMGGGPQPQPTG